MSRLVRHWPAWIVYVWVAGVALSTSPALATLVLDDPLQGPTLGTRVGGTFVAGGWQVAGQTDTIHWHVPAVVYGAAEFDVRGLYPNQCRAGMEDKVEVFRGNLPGGSVNSGTYATVPVFQSSR